MKRSMSAEADALDRGVLERKARDELQQIATALGVTIGSRAKKADIVNAILGESPEPAGPSAASSNAPDPKPETATSDSTTNSKSKVRRTRVRSSGGQRLEEPVEDGPVVPEPKVNTPAVEGPTEEPKAEWEQDVAGDGGSSSSPANGAGGGSGNDNDGSRGANPNRGEDTSPNEGGGGSRRRRRRGRDRDRDEAFQGDPVAVEGILDLRDEGYGFLRTRGLVASREDVYLPAKIVRQLGLRKGDLIVGASRPAVRNEKNPALLRVDSVNGVDPDEAKSRRRFEDLTPLFPDEMLKLETGGDDNIAGRVIDLLCPIGKGQRGLIVSPPKAGKTTVMKQIATAIESNHPEVELMVLLVDERPEEVTDMRRSVEGTVIASTFDRPAEEHTQVAELTIERAKRLVEEGKDVVVIVDGITRLTRAYNFSGPQTGRALSGGLDAGAIYPPKKFFGAARNLEEGGSLTILATALIDTGSRMDEVIFEEFKGTGNMELRLDRRLSEQRIFPAIDVDASGTRHEELLYKKHQLPEAHKLRRVLSAMGDSDGEAMTLLRDRLGTFKTNEAFLVEIGRAKV